MREGAGWSLVPGHSILGSLWWLNDLWETKLKFLAVLLVTEHGSQVTSGMSDKALWSYARPGEDTALRERRGGSAVQWEQV